MSEFGFKREVLISLESFLLTRCLLLKCFHSPQKTTRQDIIRVKRVLISSDLVMSHIGFLCTLHLAHCMIIIYHDRFFVFRTINRKISLWANKSTSETFERDKKCLLASNSCSRAVHTAVHRELMAYHCGFLKTS